MTPRLTAPQMAVLRAGHEFHDDDGNLLATLARDVAQFTPIMAADFTLPDGTTPKAGTEMPKGMQAAINRAFAHAPRP